MTTNTSLHKGRDPRYLTAGAGDGHVGGTRYYTEAAGEPPGQWAGRGAQALGLAGDVDPDTMQALYMDDTLPGGERLDARRKARYRDLREREELAASAHLALHPYATEGELEAVRAAERAKSQHATPYFDFTVSAVKSVSVLHASYLVAARQARERGELAEAGRLETKAADIVAALVAAARAAVAQIERSAYVRTGYHSTGTGEYRDAAGVVAAMFVQHTSREGDPQLHVHIAVLNRAQRADGADGKWRTLHSSMLYQERLAVAAVAARELATQLTGLGHRLVPRADGNGFEIGGVPLAVLGEFSSRRAQITPGVARMVAAYRQRYGPEPSPRTVWAMAQDVTLQTRKAKSRGCSDRSGQPARSAGEELDAWEARTTERELASLAGVHRAVAEFARQTPADAPAELDQAARARICRVAVTNAQRFAAAWTRASLLWEVHLAMPAMAEGVDQAALCAELADEALASGEVLALGPAPDVVDVSSLGVRASDGRSIFTPAGTERYTTAAWLDLEEYLVAEARREVPQLVTPAQAAAAVAAAGLDAAQAEVTAGLLAARTAVSVLVAPAGAGKTHTMAAFARAWTGWTGGRVVGVTLSTNAARVMASEGLAEAYNIAQFLGRLEDGGSKGAMRAGPRDVVVIDEASQVSTTDLAAIQAVARAGGARVILTGDTAQLGAVEAGGMMRLIAEDLGHWELAEVRRFDAEWERLASLQLRQGARAAVRAYDVHGRVRGGHQLAAEGSAVGLYLADYLMGRDSLLLAGTNEEAAHLAGLVRAELVRFGRVPDRPEVTLADGNGAAAGDLVRARANTPAVDAAGRALTNRDTLRLDGVTVAAGGRVAIMRRQLPDGGWSRDFPVPLEYLKDSAELAYAANVYVAQGRTVDTAHVYASASLSRESLYVGMSRGRAANTVHVVTGPSPKSGQPDLAQAQPEAVLADILDRTQSAWTATEVMREAQAFATNTGHLLAMYSAATRGEAYAAIDTGLRSRLSPAEYARYQGESQRPVFQRQVLAATLAGADLDEVLELAAGQDFTGARSIAAVMHGRIEAAQVGEAEHRQAVPWAQRVPEVIRPENRAVGVELGQAIDTGGGGLARTQAERPEPWVLTTLGPFPVDGSPALQADWLARVGRAAGYRQAAGITDPNMVTGPAPQAHPELLTWHAQTLRDLEIRTEEGMIWSMTQGQLEATVAAGERIKATAPAEVSRQLRAERLAEADARARGAELAVLGDHQAAQEAQARADAAGVHATVREGQAEVYAQWEERTAADRRAAELAQAELAARAKAPERSAQAEATASPDSPAGSARPVSLLDQYRQDMANLAALEARVEKEAQADAGDAAAGAPADAGASPGLAEPDAAYDDGPGVEDPDAAAEALMDLDEVELPEADATSPAEDPKLRAERLAEADARARGAELAALGDHQAAQEAMARAEKADVRATAREGQAEVYAQREADTAAERHAAAGVPADAVASSGLAEPDAAYDHAPGTGDPDAAADALLADLDQTDLPEADATSPIEDPELAAMAEELATRSRTREAAAAARQERVAEAQADRAQRAAMREAAARDADVPSPEAWVSGPHTPSWGGPQANTPEPTPEPELDGAEAGL